MRSAGPTTKSSSTCRGRDPDRPPLVAAWPRVGGGRRCRSPPRPPPFRPAGVFDPNVVKVVLDGRSARHFSRRRFPGRGRLHAGGRAPENFRPCRRHVGFMPIASGSSGRFPPVAAPVEQLLGGPEQLRVLCTVTAICVVDPASHRRRRRYERGSGTRPPGSPTPRRGIGPFRQPVARVTAIAEYNDIRTFHAFHSELS